VEEFLRNWRFGFRVPDFCVMNGDWVSTESFIETAIAGFATVHIVAA